jgi:hypothetical protein
LAARRALQSMRCRRASRRQVPAASPVAKPAPLPPHPRGPGPDGIGPDQAMGREVLMIQQPWRPRIAVGHTAVGKFGCHSALLMPEDDFAVVCLRERFLLERRVSWRSASPAGRAGSDERTVENPLGKLDRGGSAERYCDADTPLFGAYLWTVVVRSLQLAYFHSRLLRSKHDHAGVGEDQ